MAITESHETQPGSGEPPAAGRPGSRRHGPWRRWALIASAALLVTTVVMLAVLAGTYQPVQFGDEGTASFPGLPTATGFRSVNTFGDDMGEWYVPPQPGVFTIGEAIANTGPQAVTIEAVSILSPQDQSSQAQGIRPWPLTPAGQALWIPTVYGRGQGEPASGSPVAGLSLAPGESVLVGVPVRPSGTCYDPNGWTGVDTFYVEERFLFFTHWVAVKFQIPWIFHGPANPGDEPAKDLVCLTKQ